MNSAKPSYLTLSEQEWQDKIDAGLAMLEKCVLCPNNCGINRIAGKTGFCRTGFFPRIASAFAHTGEEPPISGYNGSGTIFFAGCTMRCIYCQNYPFSQLSLGRPVPLSFIKDKMLELQQKGCHNINFVTPTHVVPQLIIAVHEASKEGLSIPIVYNTSGYESTASLNLLDGIVDIYLTDLRYGSDESGQKYSGVGKYSQAAREAIKLMAQQTGQLRCNIEGIAEKGLIIRLLLLPGLLDELKDTIRFIAAELDFNPHISLMNQYFPTWKALDNPDMNATVGSDEFEQAFHLMRQYGLTNGWIQDTQQ
ncbi:MAG: radical SAM protein [Candidatus Auribacterota bacterium]|jgi:putative pyruvate formate lyase activating enzyme|nr:radical SAM protein [Candidatus Auribacterota bacterium]